VTPGSGGRAPRVVRTEAIVLRHRRFGEADRIITLLTPGRGKIDAVAKGALRPRSKLAGHLEPLTHVEVLLAQGRSLDIITQAQAVEMLPALHADLDRLSTALYLLELADRFTFERQEADASYELLLLALRRLARGDGAHLVTRGFELALLEATGFRPEWRRCVSCNAPVATDVPVSWSAGGGGVLCANCVTTHPEAIAVDGAVLRVLRAYQDGPYEEMARIRLTTEVAVGMERVMQALVQTVADREFGSARFIAASRRAARAAGAHPAALRGDESEDSGSPVYTATTE